MDTRCVGFACWLALIVLVLVAPTTADAQVGRGVFRFSLDTDILSIAGVEIQDEGSLERKVMTYGIGPNQFGGLTAQLGARLAPTPLGLGFAYGLSSKVLFGLRTGLGVDVIAPNGAEDTSRVLGLSLMPGLTLIPTGRRAKLFLSMCPIFQFSRVRVENDKMRTFLGGFGLGIGTMVFVARGASIDIGFNFEGRFGAYEDFDRSDTSLRDLRGVVRLGISLWK